MEKEKIMYESDEAAVYETRQLTGWFSRTGHFWGKEEHMARWQGCTHRRCECGEEYEKGWTRCKNCRHKMEVEKFKALPEKEWDETFPVCIYSGDEYFFDMDSLLDFCEDNECDISDIGLMDCDPIYPSLIGPDHWCDELAEDGELPDDIYKALKEFNEILSKSEPLSYQQGKHRLIVKLKG